MKKQIRRFPPHQNAKVFSVLMAVSCVPFMVMMGLMMSYTLPEVDAQGNPVDFPYLMFWLLPLFYLVFGYICIAFGCFLYNGLYRLVGGIEIELTEENNNG